MASEKEKKNTDQVIEGMELSIDELAAVAGGVTTRDWQSEGCAATVEKGSDCWGTDGGCTVCNISYFGVSESDRCRVRTTGPCVFEQVGYEENPAYMPQDLQDLGYSPRMIPTTYERCRYCGRKNITITF
ncbi:MAG: hypothetical protein IKI23_08345 [Lachnospiraceae bacterium]|jgi:hypothetical protein|nr:hypothetical protein [Lachnospiraceae bacterium]